MLVDRPVRTEELIWVLTLVNHTDAFTRLVGWYVKKEIIFPDKFIHLSFFSFDRLIVAHFSLFYGLLCPFPVIIIREIIDYLIGRGKLGKKEKTNKSPELG